jgi:hypothetical protein
VALISEHQLGRRTRAARLANEISALLLEMEEADSLGRLQIRRIEALLDSGRFAEAKRLLHLLQRIIWPPRIQLSCHLLRARMDHIKANGPATRAAKNAAGRDPLMRNLYAELIRAAADLARYKALASPAAYWPPPAIMRMKAPRREYLKRPHYRPAPVAKKRSAGGHVVPLPAPAGRHKLPDSTRTDKWFSSYRTADARQQRPLRLVTSKAHERFSNGKFRLCSHRISDHEKSGSSSVAFSPLGGRLGKMFKPADRNVGDKHNSGVAIEKRL